MIRKILRRIKRFLIKYNGSEIDNLYWRFRHIFDKSWAKSYISEQSINHAHRRFLIDKISNHTPFESVLEIGCASGPNLSLLANRFPSAKLYGIDISNKAIKEGRRYFENNNNIYLNQEKAESLDFQDKSVDIVFTDAVLIYSGPDKISLVIKEMRRVAKKAIVLFELHHDRQDPIYNDNWIHNYRLLFNVPENKIKVSKIPHGIWKGDWEKLGHVIEVDIS